MPSPLTTADGLKVYCSHHELLDPATLTPNPRNPNTHPDRQLDLLAKVIGFQGWRSPIVVSRRSGFIVRGHARRQVGIRLGCTQVPVEYQDYESEAAEWEDMIADNRLAELAELDKKTLGALLEELKAQDRDPELTGFTDHDLDKLLRQLDRPVDADRPEVPFTTELMERQDYVVLVFANEIDWLAAREHFQLDTVCTKHDDPRRQKPGLGRVIDGAAYLQRIQDHAH